MDPKEIYGKLYDIASQNMAANDMEFEYSKEAFLFVTGYPAGECDIAAMRELDNISFLEVAYVMLFYRTADIGAYERWKECRDMGSTEFQKKLVLSLTQSQEFTDKGVVLKNNIYSKHTEVNRNFLSGSSESLSANKAVNKLYRTYKKFPTPIKNTIKKILGVKS